MNCIFRTGHQAFLVLVVLPLFIILISCYSCSGLQSNVVASRHQFLLESTYSLLLLSQRKRESKSSDALTLPLRFLPNGGCLAVKLMVNDQRNRQLFSYYAFVDTGSPFLTAPPTILPYSKDESQQYPPSQEQYGESVGQMQWRSISNVEVITSSYIPFDIPQKKTIVGIPDNNVVDDTGGIFLGLIYRDDYRPSVMQQWGYSTFMLDYRDKLLTFYKTSIIPKDEPAALKLFDFSPYGDTLYHYGVHCASFTLQMTSTASVVNDATRRSNTHKISTMRRPVVAVVDSGLTGCVFSDSLRDELASLGYNNMKGVTGLTVDLPTISGGNLTLSSSPQYWFLSSFKLPWFDDDEEHPHVIAMGATFLAPNCRISVDPVSQRIAIDNER